MNQCTDPGGVEDGLNPPIELRSTTREEKKVHGISVSSSFLEPDPYYRELFY